MIEPKNYKVKYTKKDEIFLDVGFNNNYSYYVFNKPLYKNVISLKIFINKEDHHMIVHVLSGDNYYAPFYNPNERHNNLVCEKVIKNYNNIMDKLVRKGILEYVMD